MNDGLGGRAEVNKEVAERYGIPSIISFRNKSIEIVILSNRKKRYPYDKTSHSSAEKIERDGLHTPC